MSAGTPRWAVPLFLAVWGWAVLAVITWDSPGLLRAIAVFTFVLAGPGVAIVRLLPVRAPLPRVVLAVALSMSLAALAAEGFSVGRPMPPAVVLAVLAGICSAAAVAELAWHRR